MTLRKFKVHPAYQPLRIVGPFKESFHWIAMDMDTLLVKWSSHDYDEADQMAESFAKALNMDVMVFKVRLDS